MNNPIESSLDVLICLLYSPGATYQASEPIKGTTRLQKLLFLLWKEASFYENIPNLYGFKAYDFGPSMGDLYDDIDFAKELALINVVENPTGNRYDNADVIAFQKEFGHSVSSDIRNDYYLTDSGNEAGKEIFNSLEEDEKRRISLVKSKYNNMNFFELLRYVYRKYPKFAKKSLLSI